MRWEKLKCKKIPKFSLKLNKFSESQEEFKAKIGRPQKKSNKSAIQVAYL